jgi:hypothetical protein
MNGEVEQLDSILKELWIESKIEKISHNWFNGNIRNQHFSLKKEIHETIIQTLIFKGDFFGAILFFSSFNQFVKSFCDQK